LVGTNILNLYSGLLQDAPQLELVIILNPRYDRLPCGKLWPFLF